MRLDDLKEMSEEELERRFIGLVSRRNSVVDASKELDEIKNRMSSAVYNIMKRGYGQAIGSLNREIHDTLGVLTFGEKYSSK